MVTHSPNLTAAPRTITETNLTQVLSRLSSTILSPSPISSPQSPSPTTITYDTLLHSSFARTRFAGNLDYARTLLLRLEHDTAGIKIQSRRQAALGGLAKQRAVLKRLGEAFREVEAGGDESWDYVEGEKGGMMGVDVRGKAGGRGLLEEYDDNGGDATSRGAGKELESAQARQRGAVEGGGGGEQEPQNVVRNRLLPPQSPSLAVATPKPDAALTTGTDTANSNQTSTTTAALLESATSTQDALTTSLLSMAQRLKQSTQSFSTLLETDTAHLDRAVDGLDRNTAGMDAAAGRMGFLRRMSEGRGWWGRMMLYAWIGGLWVVAILLVGVGPKLRF